MIAHGSRARSGITLTEILIAILIMGVGLISLATLFPLGLLRLREATRNSRSGLTFETAADDMDARGVLYKPSFRQTWYGPRDPFVQDALSDGYFDYTVPYPPPYPPNPPPPLDKCVIASGNRSLGFNNVGLQDGLPFCYDPLWRSLTGVFPNTFLFDRSLDAPPGYVVTQANEARFGCGLFGVTQNSTGAAPFIRDDPGGGKPSAHGLQRLTNFIPWSNNGGQTTQYPFTCNNNSLPPPPSQPADVAGDVCTSIDDIVFNPTGGPANGPSSVLPDISVGNAPQADYKYTWFFTGRQLDAGGNGSQFIGEVVVCDNRPFGFDLLPGKTTQGGPIQAFAPSGETVVEAIFGFAGLSVVPLPPPYDTTTGYAQSDRTVLIRWPARMADPTIRPGGWICDVTYERNSGNYVNRTSRSNTSFVRCNWYQVSRRTDPEADSDPTLNEAYRRSILTIGSPLKAKTLLYAPGGIGPVGTPVHLNVALIMPSVINVFPRSFEVH